MCVSLKRDFCHNSIFIQEISPRINWKIFPEQYFKLIFSRKTQSIEQSNIFDELTKSYGRLIVSVLNYTETDWPRLKTCFLLDQVWIISAQGPWFLFDHVWCFSARGIQSHLCSWFRLIICTELLIFYN